LWETVPGLNLNRYHRDADSAEISALIGNGNDVVGPVVYTHVLSLNIDVDDYQLNNRLVNERASSLSSAQLGQLDRSIKLSS
jgi:hypothetical protein